MDAFPLGRSNLISKHGPQELGYLMPYHSRLLRVDVLFGPHGTCEYQVFLFAADFGRLSPTTTRFLGL
jgi:hypothetical protein